MLPVTVRFEQSTRKFGRISFARLYAYCSTSLENKGILTLPPITIITVVNLDTSKKNMDGFTWIAVYIGTPFISGFDSGKFDSGLGFLRYPDRTAL